jgi:hypothetical protein
MVAGLGVALAATPFACVIVDNGPGFGGEGVGGHGTGGTSSGLHDQCNPVSGAGCALVNGEACDLNYDTGLFACFPPPNSAPVCGDCDELTLPCGSESTCVQPGDGSFGTCYRYCCTDADCGGDGVCDTGLGANYLQPALPSDVVGLCVQGGGPACTPPASPPSGGSCIGGYQSGSGSDGGTSSGDGGDSDAGLTHGGHGDAGGFGHDGGFNHDGGGTGPSDAGTD